MLKCKCFVVPKTKSKKSTDLLPSHLRLHIRLPPAQGSDLGEPTNRKGCLVFGKLNVAHGFPIGFPVSPKGYFFFQKSQIKRGQVSFLPLHQPPMLTMQVPAARVVVLER